MRLLKRMAGAARAAWAKVVAKVVSSRTRRRLPEVWYKVTDAVVVTEMESGDPQPVCRSVYLPERVVTCLEVQPKIAVHLLRSGDVDRLFLACDAFDVADLMRELQIHGPPPTPAQLLAFAALNRAFHTTRNEIPVDREIIVRHSDLTIECLCMYTGFDGDAMARVMSRVPPEDLDRMQALVPRETLLDLADFLER